MQISRSMARRTDSVASLASTYETLTTSGGTSLERFSSHSSDYNHCPASASSIATSFAIPDIDPYQCYPSGGDLDQVAPWELQLRQNQGRRKSIQETSPSATEKTSSKGIFTRFSKPKKAGKDRHIEEVELDDFLSRTKNGNIRNAPLPPTPVAPTFTQLELYASPRRQSVSHPTTPNSSSFFKIRPIPSMPRIYQKEQTHGAVKLVVKQALIPSSTSASPQASTSQPITEAEAQSIFTTITTSSSGSSNEPMIPTYGRGGAARAIPKVQVHTKTYGSSDALMADDWPGTHDSGPGKSGGKVFIEGLFSKGGGRSSRRHANSSSATGLDGLGGPRNRSNDTVNTVSSILPPPKERVATFGRGGAGRTNKNTPARPPMPKPSPGPDIPQEIPTGDNFVPSYGRGGAARQKKKKKPQA